MNVTLLVNSVLLQLENFTERYSDDGDILSHSTSINEIAINQSTNQSITSIEPPMWISERIANMLTWYYIPTLVLTGSIGNILSVLVFFKTKLRKLSSSYYLAALGISDTCFLLISFSHWLSLADVTFYSQNIFCQFFTYFSGVCSFLSVWFVVAFTVERFIAVLYPLKRQTMCTVRRAKIVLTGLTLAAVLINSPLIFFSGLVYSDRINSTLCDVKEEFKVRRKNNWIFFHFHNLIKI